MQESAKKLRYNNTVKRKLSRRRNRLWNRIIWRKTGFGHGCTAWWGCALGRLNKARIAFSRLRSEGNCADAARAHKRVDNLRFSTLLWISPFPLDSLAQITHMWPLRNKGTAEVFYYRVFLNIFAVSDSVLLHIRATLRRCGMTVPHNSLARYNRQGLRR